MDKLSMIVAFVALVEKGSYTLAAEKIGGSKSVVSSRIRKLEEIVGLRLVYRTTRSVAITDTGRRFYRRCLAILDQMAALENGLVDECEAISGALRITAPQSFGLHYVVPVCGDFLKAHPAVQLDVELDDRHLDLVDGHFDLAVRIGHLRDSSLSARKVGSAHFVMVASPAYLAARGVPRHPQDLAELDCIFDSNKRLGRCWEAQADGGPARVPVTPRMTVNSACAVRVAALEGLGITRSFEFLVRDDLAAGRLVEVLPEATRFDVPVQIVFAHRTLMPAKLRAFIDFSAERLGAAVAADRPPLAGRPSSVSTVCP